MDLFKIIYISSQFPSLVFPIINKMFAGLLGSLAKFSKLPRPNLPAMRHA